MIHDPGHQGVQSTRSTMRTRLKRYGAILAIPALILAACGGSATPTPSAASAAPSAAATEALASTPPSTGPTPVPTVPPGGPVTIKWFCCLGGGDDPSTLKVFADVITGFNKTHPNIKLVLDHVAYEGARDAFATELASGNPPDIVGPLGVGGANAFAGQWLDLVAVRRQEQHRRQPVRPRRRQPLQERRRGPARACRSPSTRRSSTTSRTCSTRPSSTTRPPSTTPSTRCPTARWSTGTTTRSARWR